MGHGQWLEERTGGGRAVWGEDDDSAHARCSLKCRSSEHGRVRSRGSGQGLAAARV
jgi:hypothetical protein